MTRISSLQIFLRNIQLQNDNLFWTEQCTLTRLASLHHWGPTCTPSHTPIASFSLWLTLHLSWRHSPSKGLRAGFWKGQATQPCKAQLSAPSVCLTAVEEESGKSRKDPDSPPSSLTKPRYLLAGHTCLESNIRTRCDLHGSFRKGSDLSSVWMPLFPSIHHSAPLAMSPSKQELLP